MINVDSKKESFFVIDTETLGISDTAVVMDLSMVYVDMENVDSESEKPMTFVDFIQSNMVRKLTTYVDTKEQVKLGSTVDKGTVKFWNELSQNNNSIVEYLREIQSDKKSIKEVVEEVENFIITNRSKDHAIFLERSGGFDTNKYYNLHKLSGFETKSELKFWERREIRTIISCNKWRINKDLLQDVNYTKWSEAIIELMTVDYKKSTGKEFLVHRAICDCLVDAYMIYFLKITLDNFYL